MQVVTCPNDTDGDGDCHVCARRTGGCLFAQASVPEHPPPHVPGVILIGPDGPTPEQREWIDFFRSKVKMSPLDDQQVMCVRPLTSLQALHNLRHHMTGQDRPDGGFRPWGPGVSIRTRHMSFSTQDGDELTRLVIAAHCQAARISIAPAPGGFRLMDISVTARDPGVTTIIDGHPGIERLIKRVARYLPTPVSDGV